MRRKQKCEYCGKGIVDQVEHMMQSDDCRMKHIDKINEKDKQANKVAKATYSFKNGDMVVYDRDYRKMVYKIEVFGAVCYCRDVVENRIHIFLPFSLRLARPEDYPDGVNPK